MIAGTQVIDFHGHVGRWDSVGMKDDPDEMLRAMDAVGIDKSCVFNIFHPDGRTGNDLTARFVDDHPDRFIGFAYVSPLMPGRMAPELERAIDQLGMRAIKLYPLLHAFSSGPSDLGPHLRLCPPARFGDHHTHRYRTHSRAAISLPGRAAIPRSQFRGRPLR